MTGKIIAVTERLLIREMNDLDEESVNMLNQDDKWKARLFDCLETDDKSTKALRNLANSKDTYNCLICLKDNHQFVGKVCMQHTKNAVPELGITIVSEYQNKHFAGEAIIAFCNDYCKKHNLNKVLVQIMEDNSHSIHVFEKLGAEYIKTIPLMPQELLESYKRRLPEKLWYLLYKHKIRVYHLHLPMSVC